MVHDTDRAQRELDEAARLAEESLARAARAAKNALTKTGPEEDRAADDTAVTPEGIAVELLATAERAAAELLAKARHVAAARLASAHEFETMFHDHGATMLLIDPDTGQIVDANPAAASFYGYPVETLRSMSITQINTMPPDEVAELMGQARLSGHGHFTFPQRLANGEVHRVDVHSSIIGAGRPLLFSIIVDIEDRVRAEEELARVSEESRLAFDRSRVATCLVSNAGMIVRVNPAICELLGRSEPELLTLHFLEVTHPDDAAVGADLVRDLLAGRRSSLRVTKRYVTGDGGVIWGDVTVSVVLDPDGTVRYRIAQIIDVTAEHDLHESLVEAQRIAHLGGWQFDPATADVSWSPELYAMFGLDPTGPVPDHAEHEQLFTPESWQRLAPAFSLAETTGAPFEVELETLRADGTRGWMRVRGEAVCDADGRVVGLHGTALDITERKAASDVLEELATHDPLTGLANRAALLDETSRALSSAQRSGQNTAILMMDLDRFKDVNDTLGHAVGDALLVAAAARIQEVVRGADLVARLGGDEFVVVIRDLVDPAEAVQAAVRLVEAFRAPFTPGVAELFSSVSVGVAISTSSGTADDLIREADTAMYAAKGAGRDRVSVFNEDLRTAVTTRLAIQADLRHALARDQLAVWYQPEVDLATGSVIAVEALLRWHHPDGGVWTADRFIDVAENTGMILDIGDWVLRQACSQGAAWATARPDRPITMRVNLSAVQLAETGLLDAIDDALASSGLDPALLCLELTETALLRETITARENLGGIHQRGISLAIDDFGTGYASLTYLSRYPVDVIKIDRSFIADAAAQDHYHRLVAGIIALASMLGIAVTAEGVEHPDQAARLRQLGCPSAQGWLYSKALPPEQITPLLDHTYPHG